MFDVERLADFAEAQIRAFAAAHQDETFYAFFIDAQLLCLNSEEQLQKTLDYYRGQPGGLDVESVRFLRYNTGDWEYQGFAMFGADDGFDDALYDDHYNMRAERQKTSEYGVAMDRVIEILTGRDAFRPLRRAEGFVAGRVEHEGSWPDA